MAVDTTTGTSTGTASRASEVHAQLRGLDSLDAADGAPRGRRLWEAAWPKLAAAGLALLAWQGVVWSGWKPSYLLPGPGPVLAELGRQGTTPEFWTSSASRSPRSSAWPLGWSSPSRECCARRSGR
jgi:NitT/TauT family transport system permease protein